MTIGFTGTRHGMTERQQGRLMRWLGRLKALDLSGQTVFVHGCCVGADAQAHRLAWSLKYRIFGRPAYVTDKTMPIAFEQFEKLYDPAPPLVRNDLIIADCNLLLVAPRERKEKLRSGTWTTFRHAREAGRDTLIIWP